MRKLCFALSLLTVSGLIAVGCGKDMPTQLVTPDKAVSQSRVLGPGGAIGDRVWEDLNANGLQEQNEPGVEGVALVLTSLDGDPKVVGSMKTDSKGMYEFAGLLPGTYSVEVVPPKDCILTKTNAGDPALDSNKNPTQIKIEDKLDDTVDFGLICKKIRACGPCRGKVTSLALMYVGDEAVARIRVIQGKGKKTRSARSKSGKRGDGVVFEGVVRPDEVFEFEGDKKGTLGTEITIYVNGDPNTSIHTSCSRPIGIGMVFGDFEVVAGASKDGGPLCPASRPKDGGLCDDGKLRALRVRYTGSDCSATHHSQRPNKVSCWDAKRRSTPPRFPVTRVLDDFNRPDGPIGGAWVGDVGGLRIDGNALTQTADASWGVWNGAVFGPDQEVYITLDEVTATAPEHDLMLKVQGLRFDDGEIEVRYDAVQGHIVVATFTPGVGFRDHGDPIPATLRAKDHFGARAYADGGVEIYLNGVRIGMVSVASWPYHDRGGRVGLTLTGAKASRLDDFGGGNVGGAPSRVRILATNSKEPHKKNARVYFDGMVDRDGIFAIDASRAGKKHLGSNTYVYVFDRKELIQRIGFHTSCSQPLFVGDEFGSLEIVGFSAAMAAIDPPGR